MSLLFLPSFLRLNPLRCHSIEERIEFQRRFLLHRRQHVAVGIESDANASVAQSLLHDLRMSVLSQEQRRRSMPEIVKADVWQLRALENLLVGLAPQIALAQRTTVRVAEDPWAVVLFILHSFEVLQHCLDSEGWEIDATAPLGGLRFGAFELTFHFGKLMGHEECAYLRIEILAPQATQLALSETGRYGEDVQRVEPIPFGRFEEHPDLLGIKDRELLRRCSGPIHIDAGIVRDEPQASRSLQRRVQAGVDQLQLTA